MCRHYLWMIPNEQQSQIARQVRAASPVKPLAQRNFVMLDAESKVRFYLDIPPNVKNYAVVGNRDQQTTASLLKAWPFLRTANNQTNTIYVSRKQYEKQLQEILTRYTIVEAQLIYGERILKNHPNQVVVFIPKN